METNRKLNIIGTTLLAGALTLSPEAGALAADHAQNTNNQEGSVQISPEQVQYDLFLSAMNNFIRLDKCTGLNQIYQAVEKDPEKHIEIIDSHYYIFLIDEVTGLRKPNWSIQFSYDEFNKRGTIAVVIDNKWDYFKGDDDKLAAKGEIPMEVLMTISNHAFNIPVTMKNTGWETSGIENETIYLDRRYQDIIGNVYTQRVREDNVIILNAPYPLPDKNPFNDIEREMIIKDEDSSV